MNVNRHHDPVTIYWNDILKLKQKYKDLCNTIDYQDMRVDGVIETDEGPLMSPMEYAFILGQICELEGFLLYVNALTEREIFQSRKFKAENIQEEDPND